MQKYTSENTSLNQVARCFKLIEIKKGMKILDYGCGKYDKAKEFVNSLQAEYFGYDPFNRSEEENLIALSSNPDIIICANVLNVIMEEDVIEEIVKELYLFNCDVVIQIYEGDKSKIGKETTKGYQRNESAIEYYKVIVKYFDEFTKKGNIYFCKNS